ncbi:MAG: biopolymer transporter ExbD [Opitutales bacterium]|jgi:biopolymer transport protein ExbD|nr:biopolymer transporter ExbD [Opitutales bacterium]|tara:strand:+ start:762 stop:1163 length:402 start_codon:yes stop_codon:yes gene_type:complete
MKLRRKVLKREEIESVNVSPLIDVIFILLIFFIVSASFVKTPGIEVNRPHAITADNLRKNSILFALGTDGHIHYGGETLPLSQVQPLVEDLRRDVDVPVIIQVDQEADGAQLARLIRQASMAGAPVSIATRKP